MIKVWKNTKMKSMRKIKGFTLVELLIVMSIIGVLVTIVGGGFRSSQFRGRDAQRKSDLKQVASALELYYSDYGKYPDTITWGAEFSDTKTVFMKKLPVDPVSSQSYYYRTFETNQKYQLFARLENLQDRDLITTSYNNCGGDCNFSITSSNTTPDE